LLCFSLLLFVYVPKAEVACFAGTRHASPVRRGSFGARLLDQIRIPSNPASNTLSTNSATTRNLGG
jgi:hypothetical protein